MSDWLALTALDLLTQPWWVYLLITLLAIAAGIVLGELRVRRKIDAETLFGIVVIAWAAAMLVVAVALW